MIALSAFLAALAVLCGAFGAHALKNVLDPQMLAVWNTGAHYHLVHAVALVGLALARRAGIRKLSRSWHLLMWGCVVFSGSLYALSTSGFRWVGAVTPVGGALLVAGWLMLAWDARRAD